MTVGETVRANVFVSGQVQGVGFRWWTRSRALELGLVGHARNLFDGRVEVCAQGARADVEALVALLDGDPRSGRPGRVSSCTTQWLTPRDDLTGFVEA